MATVSDQARIMIVEDEAIIAGEIRMIMEKFGYAVTSIADTGQGAIEQAEADRPDLILMDINLKGDMDGIEAAGIIRDRLDIPVIYLTASVEGRKLERAKRTVPAGYVLKPFSEHDLRVALEVGLYVAETGKKNVETRKRLAAAERIAGFGSCEMEIDSGRCVWSDEFFRICGYEPGVFEPDAEMSNRIIHPEDRERAARLLRDAIESGREYDIEKRLVRPDGSVRYVHSLGSVIRDAGGRPVRIIRTIRDITDRKLLERQNRLNNLRLEIISEIAMLTEAGEKEICDLVLERMLALSGSRIGYLGFLTADETTMVIHAWSHSAMAACEIRHKPVAFSIDGAGLWGEPVRRRGPVVVNDYAAYHEIRKGIPPGHVPVARFLSFPVFDQGRIVALAAVGNKEDAYTPEDVNQLSLLMQGAWEQIRRRRLDRIIVESEKKYRSLISNIPDVTWTSDTERNTTFVSDNIEIVLGFTTEEIYAAGPGLWFGRIHPEDLARVKSAYDELFEKKANFDIEYRIQREDGAWIWLHDRAISVYEKNGVKYADGIFSDITERRRMEENLRESELLYRTLFDDALNPIVMVDVNGNYIDANAAALEFLECDRNTLLDMNIRDFAPPDQTGRQKREHSPFVGRRTVETDYLVRGKIKTLLLNVVPLKIKKRTILYGIGQDITIRRQVEDELRFQSRILSQIQDFVTVTDLDGGIVYVNDAVVKAMKRSREELLDASVLSLGEDTVKGASQERIMAETLQNGQWQGLVVNRSRDGRELILDCRTSLIHDRDGKPVNMIGVSTDVTEREKAENALAKSEAQLRAVFEAAENIAFIITDGGDPNPIIIECSPGAEKIYGYSRQEMIGRSVEMLHQPDDFKRIPETRKHMRIGQKGFSGEITLIRKNGEPFPALLTTYPLLDEKGLMYASLGIAVDISQQKRLEEQLRQSQKMESIGTLAGGIAHDFNNILYPIIGHSEMLIEDLEGDPSLQDRARTILNSALRAAGLVRQILSFSRQSQREKSAVKIQDIIREVLLLIRHSLPAYITINLKIDDSCSPVMADAGQIHQVIMNLITNAAHAMEGAPGTLAIGLSETGPVPGILTAAEEPAPGKFIDLYVSDTGTGMDETVVNRIFDPFFTTKEVGKGSGLGLSVTYGIVKQHDGVIRVESRPGQGSVFHVYLPVAGDDLPAAEDERTALLSGQSMEHILLVDDDRDIVDLVGPMLKRQGYRVTSRTCGREALATFRRDPERVDLVITDMTMPNMTGSQLAVEIRRIRPDLPIILCTGFSEQIDEDKARTLGITAFLMKPVARDQLVEVVRRALDEIV